MRVLNVTLLILVSCIKLFANDIEKNYNLKSEKGNWNIIVNQEGKITKIKMLFGSKVIDIPWRSEYLGGPSWEGIALRKVTGGELKFEAKKGNQIYGIEYTDVNGKMTITASIKNESAETFMVDTALRLNIGIDSEMKDPEKYFRNFFPTLLRCEKTHFWGYFQNPNGNILTISSPDAIASRQINYLGQGHRIATSSLDMLHITPLPKRHPQDLNKIAANEVKEWRLILEPVEKMDDVLPKIAENCKAAAINLDRTTISPGETLEIKIYTLKNGDIPLVKINNPEGVKVKLPKKELGKNFVKYTLSSPKLAGNYTIEASINGKITEALFHVRKPWGWYLNQARSEALRMQIKPMKHREGWLSFFSAYWAQLYFPDEKKLAETEKIFENFYSLMVDTTINDFYHNKPTWHTRPQNTSWMVGMLVARYAATKKIEDLVTAAKWGDLLIKKFQLPNGAYQGYTALTLGSKFLEELAYYEKPLAGTHPVWKDRYDRHLKSAEQALENLLVVKDLGDTEGQATYEDTQAGSAWSLLALKALQSSDLALRNKYLKASIEVQKRHECLTQALIPDGRMRNGTLRFWESQYDVLTLPNMMNSPHGWTMRSQFGALYLYLLTGEEQYLNLMNNAMGACAQAIDENTGELRWAFVPDPYINAEQFVEDIYKPGKGKIVNNIIGEQWLPMISDWWRVPEGKIGDMTKFKELGHQGVSQGWSCDNDVHEHFRVLTEEFIPNAFVLEREDGSLSTLNCEVKKKADKLIIKLPEGVVSRVHFNLKKQHEVIVDFKGKNIREIVEKGMNWVGPGVNYSVGPDLYIPQKNISLN